MTAYLLQQDNLSRIVLKPGEEGFLILEEVDGPGAHPRRRPEPRSQRILRTDRDEFAWIKAERERLKREAEAAEKAAFEAQTLAAVRSAGARMARVADAEQAFMHDIVRRIRQARNAEEEEALMALVNFL